MMVLKCDNHLSNSDEDHSEINMRSNKHNIAHYHYQNHNHITGISRVTMTIIIRIIKHKKQRGQQNHSTVFVDGRLL